MAFIYNIMPKKGSKTISATDIIGPYKEEVKRESNSADALKQKMKNLFPSS